jgi:site-specific recombinase XerD
LILALNAGLRLSEQYLLRWEDVSFARRSLTVAGSKNGSARHVRLNQAAPGALETLRDKSKGSEFVCGGAKTSRKWFEPAVLAPKLEHFFWHCLRHTFASRLVMAGVDIRTVQELLGHKTISMTVRYAHLAPQHQLAAVERLDAPTASSSDTTTDTGASKQETLELAIAG